MSRYSDQVRDEFGRPVPNVTVYVYEWDDASQSTGLLLALLDDDLVTALPNPLTTDEFGEFYFNWAGGSLLLEFHYGGRLQYREQVREGQSDSTLRADLAAAGGAALIGAAAGGTIQSKVFGTDLGQLGPGVIGDMVVTRQFSGSAGGTSGLYGENNQVVANGPNAIDSVRAKYIGVNLDTNANLLEAAHFFTWIKASRTAAVVKTVEAHFVADANAAVSTEANVYNVAGIVLGAGVTVPKLIGYNCGAITDGSKVVNAYCFNAEHQQASTETAGYRSQVRSATGCWSFLANTNDGSAPAPAGFAGKVKIGSETLGATPAAPAYDLDLLGNATDYAARIGNRNGGSPFGLRIQYTTAAPNDASHDFIHAEDNVAVRFQVASNGNISIAGTKVLGPRQTGWAAATGTATRTSFATGSVTLPQLAQALKALIDDLISQGIIGP